MNARKQLVKVLRLLNRQQERMELADSSGCEGGDGDVRGLVKWAVTLDDLANRPRRSNAEVNQQKGTNKQAVPGQT